MDITIREVTTKADFRRFVRFPLRHFRNNPNYVPNLIFDEKRALDRGKNPAFSFCEAKYWLAFRDGRVVGRVAGIINDRYIKKWGNYYARFGWLDFEDDPDVSALLIETVVRWADERGMKALHGPLGFTDLDEEGMLVEGFDELGTLSMLYNEPYYPRHLERLGFRKDVDWIEFEIEVPDRIPRQIARVERLVLRRTGAHVVKFAGRKEVLAYAPGIFGVLNQAYRDLYGVTELDEAQQKAYTKQYFGFIHKDFIKVVINERKEVVAFGIAMPSLSHALRRAWGRLFPFGFIHLLRALHSPRTIDLYLVAVHPDYQGMGMTALLIASMFRSCSEHGVTSAESSGHLENNRLVQALWKNFDVRQHKRRRVYIRELE